MKPFALILFLAMSTDLVAQSNFFHIDQALQQSAAEDKPIMLVFSGSDWCKPCIQLKKEILETEAFAEISHDLIFMNLDFPYKKANRLSKEETDHNEQLAEQYNKEGHFPRIIFVNHKGRIIQEILFEKGKSTKYFITSIKNIIKIYGNDKS